MYIHGLSTCTSARAPLPGPRRPGLILEGTNPPDLLTAEISHPVWQKLPKLTYCLRDLIALNPSNLQAAPQEISTQRVLA